MADGLRVPPHSVEAEQSVLGSLLLDNGAFDVVAERLKESSFYRHEHRLIYAAMAALISGHRTADVITVHDALKADGVADDVGGIHYLNALAQSVPSGRNAAGYADIVAQRAQCRQLVALADELAAGAYAQARPDGDIAGLVDKTVLGMLGLQQGAQRSEPLPVQDLVADWLDALQARADGVSEAIPTGLRDLDRVLGGGLWPGDLYVFGARPSMGKSAFSLTVARNISAVLPAAVLTMEDSAPMLLSRQVAALGRVNLADIRNPSSAPESMWEAVTEAVEALRSMKLYIDDQACLSLMDVRRKAMQVARRHGGKLGLVVVDYLQLMEDEGETRAYVLAGIARGLKRLAKELNVPVVLLSQLSREADKLNGPPRLEHLRESGAIEEAADVVGLLWREARRNPKPDNKHKAQVELAKHKNGATDTVHLWFDGATQRFEDLATEEA